jgi:predicted O-methyltransferase YrrM
MTSRSDVNEAIAGDRFHVEGAHRLRLDPLPFARSDAFSSLVSGALKTTEALLGDDRSENPYALQPDTLRLLEVFLERQRPKLVLEFGSGSSTSLFSTWAAANGSHVLSVEHDRGWVDRVRAGLPDAARGVTELLHRPLRLVRHGLRLFLTYQNLERLHDAVRDADLVLIDGPHVSGREPVLYAVLSHCTPGTIVVIDDCRHYAIREMVQAVVPSLARCFVAEELENNSHGLCVLRCETSPTAVSPAGAGPRMVLRSYWRCLRDFRQYGSGD